MTLWNEPMPREHLHSKECLSSAMISAIQNLRDLEEYSDHEFRLDVQDNVPLRMADDYLAEGIVECRCPAELRDATLRVLGLA